MNGMDNAMAWVERNGDRVEAGVTRGLLSLWAIEAGVSTSQMWDAVQLYLEGGTVPEAPGLVAGIVPDLDDEPPGEIRVFGAPDMGLPGEAPLLATLPRGGEAEEVIVREEMSLGTEPVYRPASMIPGLEQFGGRMVWVEIW
jgi:hypothetical protein